ncbi:PDZ and LIM domain protein 3 isoform X3 [Phlebotomus argentipes]|uniref:PDZ and LIM domain protein 3 isoform X3 n=1 Tax=Phlebotomus argentipes TaxID=94469 RepID=UPI002893330F|nr:PDZ and LIM domain protein 3 isoform X3 [Phlebotomus argentipes]
MSPKLNEFVVILQRDGAQTPWGIRLVGGSDLDTPLIITKVTLGSPAYGELVRGDMITKIQDYDSRDLRHEDAQHLFKNAGNRIKVVVQRNNVVANQSLSNGSSRCSSTVPPLSPVSQSQLSPIPNSQPYRHVSPAGARLQSPYDSLPQTVFPRLNEYGGYEAPQLSPRPPSSASFSPHLTRDYQAEAQEEASVILNQPYRTTPLILPGAKVKKDTGPTESYLRHHPNPAMRGPPHHDFQDVLMKQKVVHKQFNSPIGLYSDNNIEKTIHQTAPNSVPSNGYTILDRPKPTKIQGYKKTVLYDPLKSETYRAIQEDTYDVGNPHEVPQPVQTKVFQPTHRGAPQKKPTATYPPVSPNYALGDPNEIHQSGSFKRLMYSVMGDTSY